MGSAQAQTIQVAEVVPAVESPQLAKLRLRPAFVTASLGGFEQAAPPQPKLTNALLAAYVQRQQQLKAFDHFDVTPEPELTQDVLLGYIARQRNPALEAIDAASAKPEPSVTPSLLAAYVESGYKPTEVKIKLADDERNCLTMAIYHEARGESVEGQYAVANIIINRAFSGKFPSTICGVVFQNADKGYHKCQFTFACDGRSDVGTEKGAWKRAMQIADDAFAEFQRGKTPGILPKSALFYHTTAVAPSWSYTYRRVAAIGSHIFYSPS